MCWLSSYRILVVHSSNIWYYINSPYDTGIDTMNSKATMTISSLAIAAVALLFASGHIVGNQQAQAYVYYHGHYYLFKLSEPKIHKSL